MGADITLIRPDWPAPANVKAVITTRKGGVCTGTHQGANMALHVHDDPICVQKNRDRLRHQLDLQHIQWLEQIHSTQVVSAQSDGMIRTADGCTTQTMGLACAVMTADCLPILLCDSAGQQVAAIHAGWRGLANGIVAEAVRQFAAKPAHLLAYLGPAIGARHFEVGVDVLEAFFALAGSPEAADAIAAAFTPGSKPLKFYADIFTLGRLALQQSGVTQIYGGHDCTVADPTQFFSYRRDGETGRMASLIWLD